ncbi:hypothetical protein MY9_3492 [Bacillus sp. JS]|nr:hypothetical protein MY9_3492 [Bacillus sp. JS]
MINKEARGFLASLFFTNTYTRDKMNESQSFLGGVPLAKTNIGQI